ncbi:hypothetical protein LSAT2_010058 [Lamellibrachia satsuma]|nr:hypothetical protein LSAT2_010058 [Lamellibrachia satsuma]
MPQCPLRPSALCAPVPSAPQCPLCPSVLCAPVPSAPCLSPSALSPVLSPVSSVPGLPPVSSAPQCPLRPSVLCAPVSSAPQCPLRPSVLCAPVSSCGEYVVKDDSDQSTGDSHWRRQSLEETVSGETVSVGDSHWRRQSLEETVSGGDSLWRRQSLEETVSGGDSLWGDSLWETVSGGDSHWRRQSLEGDSLWGRQSLEETVSVGRQSLEETVSGGDSLWRRQSLGRQSLEETVSGGESLWGRQSLEETVSVGESPWRRQSLEQTVSGGDSLWRRQSLEETVSGGDSLWRRQSMEETVSVGDSLWGRVSGGDSLWRRQSLEETVSGGDSLCRRQSLEESLWRRQSLEETVSGGDSLWGRQSLEETVSGGDSLWRRESLEETLWRRSLWGRSPGGEVSGGEVWRRVSGGDSLWRRQSLEERVSGGESLWRRQSLEETVSGGDSLWRRQSLGETVSGGDSLWRRQSLEETVSGGDSLWRRQSLGEKAGTWNRDTYCRPHQAVLRELHVHHQTITNIMYDNVRSDARLHDGVRSYAIKLVQLEPEAKTTFDSEKLPLQYANNSIPFNASDQMRRTFMPPSGSYHTLTPDKMADFVFVTAASSNHFAESVDAIASIQTLMPEKKILYFDIGLKADQIAQVKSWCSVTYRYFNMSGLPKFVSKNLFICAWKPFVIETVLREYNALFWIDASFRLKTNNLSDAYRVARNDGGFVGFHDKNKNFRTGDGHSNFAVTHPDMYRYLPTDINAQKKIVQFRGGILLIYRTEKVFRDILWWFVMCAQEARCFVPNFNIYCNFAPHDRYTKFAKCHRFDQASINIIMSNIWMRDNSMLYTADDAFFNIVRGVTHKTRRVNRCDALEVFVQLYLVVWRYRGWEVHLAMVYKERLWTSRNMKARLYMVAVQSKMTHGCEVITGRSAHEEASSSSFDVGEAHEDTQMEVAWSHSENERRSYRAPCATSNDPGSLLAEFNRPIAECLANFRVLSMQGRMCGPIRTKRNTVTRGPVGLLPPQ